MRKLVISDVHGNAEALSAVLEAETYDELLMLGDAVHFGPRPGTVLDTLRELPVDATFIMGNHDRAFLAIEDERKYVRGTEIDGWRYNERVSSDAKEFMRSFVDHAVFTIHGTTYRAVHGDLIADTVDVDGWSGYLFPDTDVSVYERVSGRYDEDVVLFGHSHVQFAKLVDGTVFFNPGTVGQHRLGTVEAAYAVIDDGNAVFKSAPYDATVPETRLADLHLDERIVRKREVTYSDGVLDGFSKNIEGLRGDYI